MSLGMWKGNINTKWWYLPRQGIPEVNDHYFYSLALRFDVCECITTSKGVLVANNCNFQPIQHNYDNGPWMVLLALDQLKFWLLHVLCCRWKRTIFVILCPVNKIRASGYLNFIVPLSSGSGIVSLGSRMILWMVPLIPFATFPSIDILTNIMAFIPTES